MWHVALCGCETCTIQETENKDKGFWKLMLEVKQWRVMHKKAGAKREICHLNIVHEERKNKFSGHILSRESLLILLRILVILWKEQIIR